jgi:bifunctional pyridoxal-dependent enzyme with beta-cystathionase and maltose regulon repressor activities
MKIKRLRKLITENKKDISDRMQKILPSIAREKKTEALLLYIDFNKFADKGLEMLI